MIKNTIRFKGDSSIWVIVFFLSLFSLAAVYSAEGFQTVIMHFFKLFAGVVVLFLVHKIPAEYYSGIGRIMFFGSAFFLFVLLLPLGSLIPEINGAKRWIPLPFGLTFQPSDIAKIGVIMFLSRNLIKHKTSISQYKNFLKYLLAPLILIVSFIIPHDFSTSVIILFLGFVLFFFGGVKMSHLFKTIAFIFLFFALLYIGIKKIKGFSNLFPRGETWVLRIDNFTKKDQLNKSYNFQAIEARKAMSNGGWKGVGPGKSLHRSTLPEAGSDYIYAIIVEEYGLFGGGFVLVLYLWLLFIGNKIYFNIKNNYRGLIVLGLTFSIVLQALVNISVAIGLFPVTGQNLPLISTGGTSIIVTCINFGFIIGITKNIK